MSESKPSEPRKSAAERANEWAKAYYGDRAVMRSTPAGTAGLLDNVAGRQSEIKEGVPDLPRPQGSDEGIEISELLDSCRVAAREGYGLATLRALWWCLVARPEEPLPAWLRSSVVEAVGGWEDHTWRSLEEAFHARRPRAKAADAHYLRMHGASMWIDAQRASEAGVGRTRVLYSEIAERYGTNATTVERIISGYRKAAPSKLAK